MEANPTRRRQVHLLLVVAGVAVAAAIATLPWHTYALNVPGADPFRLDRTGLQSPEEGYGQLALVVAIALVLVVAYVLARGRDQPDVADRFELVIVVLSVAVTAVIALKLAFNVHFLGTGARVSAALGIVIGLAGLSLRRPWGHTGRPGRPRRPIPPG